MITITNIFPVILLLFMLNLCRRRYGLSRPWRFVLVGTVVAYILSRVLWSQGNTVTGASEKLQYQMGINDVN